MKDRPILFSGPMVKAILEGRKTQTRRVVKLPAGYIHQNVDLTRLQDGFPDGTRPVFGDCDCEPNAFSVRNPHGQPGDRLWVKETWNVVPAGRPAPLCGTAGIPKSHPNGWGVMYQASGDICTKPVGWRPSIHMPRWASRITLEITGVRVERLNEISEEDSVAEGCPEAHLEHTEDCRHDHCALAGGVDDCCGYLVSAKMQYKALWESINGNGSWDLNPWVWVIEFKRI